MRVRGSTDCINFKAVALILKRSALELTRCARVNFKARVKETCIEFSTTVRTISVRYVQYCTL